jgi:ABC-type amino acid transport substrate-binding protein
MNAIAADAGLEIEYVNTRWDGIFVALAEGEFDAVISAATITEEREEIVDFSDAYFNAGQSIAVAAALAEDVSEPEDLAGLRIGVQLGTTGDEYASEIDGAEVVRFDEITLAFQALGAGEVDAIINDGPTSADIIANSPDLEAVIVGEPLTDEFYGIAVNPERSDVLDAINGSLANVIADGTYAEIYEEWFGQEPSAAFMPMEDMGDMAMEIDRTDPASTAMGIVGTFFVAESPADLLAFACADANPESPLLPDQDTLDGFEGVTADLSEFTITIEENDDGTVNAIPDGTIILVVGGNESPIPASLLGQQLGIDSITLYENSDGEWEICPE